MLHCVIWKKFTDVSEVLTASSIRAISKPWRGLLISLMMEAVSTSETLVNPTRLHGATSQKTVVFDIYQVRKSAGDRLSCQVLCIFLALSRRIPESYFETGYDRLSDPYLFNMHYILRGTLGNDSNKSNCTCRKKLTAD
jgi:hypothetical protein